jgi:hypothetical protein
MYQKFLLEDVEVDVGDFQLKPGEGRGVANTITG